MYYRKLSFLFIEKEQLPPETSQTLELRPNSRHQTLELRIITLENIIDELEEKLKKLEIIISKLSYNG